MADCLMNKTKHVFRELYNYAFLMYAKNNEKDITHISSVTEETSQELLSQYKTNVLCSICFRRRQRMVNFMTLNFKGR